MNAEVGVILIVGILQVLAILAVGIWAIDTAKDQLGQLRRAADKQQEQNRDVLTHSAEQERVRVSLMLFQSMNQVVALAKENLSPLAAVDRLAEMERTDLDDVIRMRGNAIAGDPIPAPEKKRLDEVAAACAVANNYFIMVESLLSQDMAKESLLLNLADLARIALRMGRKVAPPRMDLRSLRAFVDRMNKNQNAVTQGYGQDVPAKLT